MNKDTAVKIISDYIVANRQWLPDGNAQAVLCMDETLLSVQASENHYCAPKSNSGPWTHVEVGPLENPPDEWADYESGGVYVQVPCQVVIDFINQHGGMVDQPLPEQLPPAAEERRGYDLFVRGNKRELAPKEDTDIRRFAVQLSGLPWHWVPADRVFESAQELVDFAVLSKDAPSHLALALDLADGYYQFCQSVEDLEGALSGFNAYLYPLDTIYLPLGFALDVEAWREAYGAALPVGHWESYADMTKTVAEGGDADRWWDAHYVGPSWWVVDFPA